MIVDQRNEANELACTSIILHLSDQVLRKVGKLDNAKTLWDELEKNYLVKSFPNKLLCLERFFNFKIDSSKDTDDNLGTVNSYYKILLILVIRYLR